MRRFWIAVTLFVLVAMVLSACGGGQPAPATQAPATAAPAGEPTKAPAVDASKFKVAFVYVAPIGDLGWTWAQDQGRLAVEKELGVETAFIESVPEGPDAERVIRDFAQKGYNLIFTTSFGFMDPTATVAKEFPQTTFVHISGYKTADNLSTVFGGIEEARYLSGLVAGKMTKSNIVGYVAAFPIPEVIRGINGFTEGVREANANAEVRVVWTQTWFDPVKEKEAAEALLDQGADIIAQHQDTTEPQKAAKDRGAFSIGYDSDMTQFVGDTVLTSPVWNWGPKYIEITKAVMAGTYKTESFYGQFKDPIDIFDLAPLSPRVPADVKALVDERKAQLEAGSRAVFCGPLKSANGTEVLPAGKCMNLDEKLNMDFFIEGVKGEAPGQGKALQGEAAPTGAAAPAAAGGEKPKVAFVYVAPIGDLGWTWAQDQGRLALEKELGVETAFIESVPEGPDAERVIRDFAQKGYKVIFTTSFGFMDPTATVAKEFPDTWFVHISGYKTDKNLSTVFGGIEEARYLSGLVAGKMTKSNIVGYVAAFPIPEVIRGINGFTQGVREANPSATVRVVWTQTWFDPVKEKEAAEALLDEGADIIAQHQDTTEPQKAAKDRGAFSIGYDSDMTQFVGDSVLTSPVWNWGPKYIEIVKAVMAGTYKTESFYGQLKDEVDIFDLAPMSPRVPADVKTLVDERKAQMEAGEFALFCGPLKSANGTEVLPAGKCMTLDEKLNMDFFIEGVRGEAPNAGKALQGEDAPKAGAAPSGSAAASDVKAAFIYVGPVGDLGWSYAHDQGRLAMAKELGIETAIAEAVPEGPDAERVIRDFAQKGFNVIVATSFGYMDSVLNVAKDYPDVKFLHATGYKTAENVGIYDGRGYQGWYLAGIVAGKATKTNSLGYVAPYPIPEVIRNMNAFALGARSVNSKATVTPIWINAWFDPAKEREAAQALLDGGVDVIARESDSVESDKLAEQEGVFAIGYNAVSADVAPNAVLTAPVWDWSVYYTQVIKDIQAGKWTSAPVWWGIEEGLLSLAPYGKMVPADVQALVEKEQQRIVSGEFDVFAGPIKDNTGKERIAAGKSMTDEEKLAFDWLVEGVKGTIPQ